jgi:hypothetical protein
VFTSKNKAGHTPTWRLTTDVSHHLYELSSLPCVSHIDVSSPKFLTRTKEDQVCTGYCCQHFYFLAAIIRMLIF